jgi:hypothetical protein
MSSTDQKTTKAEPLIENNPSRIDESFQQDHLDDVQQPMQIGEKTPPSISLFEDRLQDAFQQETSWVSDPIQNKPSLEEEQNQSDTIQLEWALAQANVLLGLGIDLGLNNQDSPPQMSPREIAIKLQLAVQHPDRELKAAAISVINAMNIPLDEVLSNNGIDAICSHLSSL